MPHPPTGHARWLSSLAVACLAGTSAIAATTSADVTLETHEQRSWKLPDNLERVAIADPSVADLMTLKGRGEALLIGKAPGQTTLLLWLRGAPAPQRIRITVRGAVPAQLLDGSGTQLSVQDNQALLQGSADTLLEHERGRAAAQASAGDKGAVNDTSTVASGGVVQVEVKVVEFDKNALSKIGLSINYDSSLPNNGFRFGLTSPTGVATGTGSSSALNSAFSIVGGSVGGRWNASLSALQSNGMARVLAEPTLVALSGQSARFLAGGELPIPEPQGFGTTTITYKPFGIGLTVTPTVLAPERIALKVAPEASDLDYSNAVTFSGVQIPAITTRRADTTVELGDGESFVIGGLVSRSTSSQVDKVPLLGDIPILGAFFRNLRYERKDMELVIVVTPHLVQPLARGTALPLPGQHEEQHGHAPWGSWLLHPAGPDQLPGFSR